MTELKLCPFCGGDGSLSLNIQCKVVFGSCWVCGAQGPRIQYKDNLTDIDIDLAVREWNRRAEEAEHEVPEP